MRGHAFELVVALGCEKVTDLRGETGTCAGAGECAGRNALGRADTNEEPVELATTPPAKDEEQPESKVNNSESLLRDFLLTGFLTKVEKCATVPTFSPLPVWRNRAPFGGFEGEHFSVGILLLLNSRCVILVATLLVLPRKLLVDWRGSAA